MVTDIATQTPAGLLIRVYPPQWSDDAVGLISAWGLKAYESAPRLGAWLTDLATGEQERRLHASYGRLIEVTPVVLPFTQWNNRELGQALVATSVLSYATTDHVVGKFFDRLVQAINVAAAARLNRNGR